jgi:hypothetical protein
MSGVRSNPHIPDVSPEQSHALGARNKDRQDDHQCQNEGGSFGARVRAWNVSKDVGGVANMKRGKVLQLQRDRYPRNPLFAAARA